MITRVPSGALADLARWASLMESGEEPTSLVDVLLATCRRPGTATPSAVSTPTWPFLHRARGVHRPAKAVCAECLVREEYLSFALADPHLEGIWGGTTARERGRLRRRQLRDQRAA